MHATDLQTDLPLVDRRTTAVEAARLIARDRLAALVVADFEGSPVAVISSADVLRLMVPTYVLDDMSLAGVLDEAGADEVWGRADDRTVGELLDDDGVNVREILRVDPDSTLVEVAAQMVESHTQVALVKGSGDSPKFVTLPEVMDAILTVIGADGDGE